MELLSVANVVATVKMTLHDETASLSPSRKQFCTSFESNHILRFRNSSILFLPLIWTSEIIHLIDFAPVECRNRMPNRISCMKCKIIETFPSSFFYIEANSVVNLARSSPLPVFSGKRSFVGLIVRPHEHAQMEIFSLRAATLDLTKWHAVDGTPIIWTLSDGRTSAFSFQTWAFSRQNQNRNRLRNNTFLWGKTAQI